MMVSLGRLPAQVLADSIRLIPSFIGGKENHTSIFDIEPQDDGLIWLGTMWGLAQFDGATIQYLEIRDEEGRKINANPTIKVVKSKLEKNVLYLCTQKEGLIEYNTHTGIGISHRYNPTIQTSLRSNNITDLIEEENGNFWVSTGNFTLSYFDRQLGEFTHFYPPASVPRQQAGLLGEMEVCPLDQDRFWLGSRFGLYSFDKVDKVFNFFPFSETYDYAYTPERVPLLSDPQEKVIWVGQFHHGIWRYDPTNGKPVSEGVMFSDITDYHIQNVVWGMYFYNQKSLLLSSRDNGFVEINRQTGQSIGKLDRSVSGLTVKNMRVRTFYRDTLGHLWLASGKGLLRMTTHDPIGQFIPYEHWLGADFVYHRSLLTKKISKNNWLRADLFSAYGDRLYLGTKKGDGLLIYEIEQDSFWHVRYQSGPDYKQTDIWMDDLCEDHLGRLWIGSENGLLYFHDGLQNVQKQFLDNKSIDQAHIAALAFQAPYLYIGTRGNGILRLNCIDMELKPFSANEQLNLLPEYDINKLFFDQKGQLWIGTKTGLFIFHPDQEQFLPFSEDEGGGKWLAETGIVDIVELLTGDIFLTTNGNGLAQYQPKDRRWKNFLSRHDKENFLGELVVTPNQHLFICTQSKYLEFNPGLPNADFPGFRSFLTSTGLERSLIAFPDGRIWAGENRGLEEVRIPALEENYSSNLLYLKNIRVNGVDKWTSSQLWNTTKLHLSYDENTFSFSLGSLNFAIEARNFFSQKLEGVDKDWIVAPANNTLTYANVPPGKYRFLYRASDQSGRWTEKNGVLDIIIRPPWWRSNGAYAAYTFLLIGILFFIRRQIIQREHLRTLLQIEKLRARFFANISHEFRTPLTLIKAPLEDLLISRPDDKDRKAFHRMHLQCERLLHLINQLLDLSKMESGILQLEPKATNVPAFLGQLAAGFESLTETKQLNYQINLSRQEFWLMADREKLEQIVVNLLANAIKFAPVGGWVSMEVKNYNPLRIRVGNNGDPIPKEEIDKIFNRFYQMGDRRHQGAGIGLSLVRELVELHNGKLGVESSSEKGTWFWIDLPLEKTEALPLPTEEVVVPEALYKISNNGSYPSAPTNGTLAQEKPLLLIVEDHSEVRTYIREKLQDDYVILEATDGQSGLKQALDKLPDLILSDLMMPQMDGLSFCEHVKSDPRTNHIPFILLTAKADILSRLEGLSRGADDYLAKPFNSRELQLRVHNLIEQRRKLRQRFMQSVKLEPQELELDSVEHQFLKKAVQVVEDQIENPDFKVEDFAKALFLSRTHLHRKLKNLTGESASDFIRKLRLQRAAQLLEANADSVTQIAFRVGFSSQSYFTKCFKAKFGVAPSEYRESQVQKEKDGTSVHGNGT